MSINIKYYPEDKNKSFASLGIKLPMNANTSKSNSGIFNVSYTTEEQVVSNYINLLLTRRGERYMQPDFGIGIQEKIFENNTQGLRDLIRYEIETQSQIWLPYVFNDAILIDEHQGDLTLGTERDHALHIVLKFRVFETGANREIVVFGRNGTTNIEVN